MPFVILPVHRGTPLTLSIITCHHITLPHACMHAVDNGSSNVHKAAHLFILINLLPASLARPPPAHPPG